jgi:predicted Zn-dependent protease
MNGSREIFDQLTRRVLGALQPREHLFITFAAESSQFVRLNAAKVRQIGTVEDTLIELTYLLEEGGGVRKAVRSTTLTGLSYVDNERLDAVLASLRLETPSLPMDPYAQLPKAGESSISESGGAFPPPDQAVEALLGPLLGKGIDLAGIYAAGILSRGMANSAGLTHWFETSTFSLDYSLYTSSQRAIKGTYAGQKFDAVAYQAELAEKVERLKLLDRPARKLARGAYRVFLEPSAFADFVMMMSWGGVGEGAIRQGDSPLRLMRSDHVKFSPQFTLSEDFRGGEVPRFNDEGELAPALLPVIESGELRNSLVGSRSHKEYGVPSNGAAAWESLRAPSIRAGTMPKVDALAKLGTGIFVSNLHYLNWSDQPGGRVTGMTRYACFWVENGEIVAPIENLRFDDTLFSVLGDPLEALTIERSYLPDVGTYRMRNPGGVWSPGALIAKMEFTL